MSYYPLDPAVKGPACCCFISGNRVVISATGLAYVFEFDGDDWEITHQVAPADDYFALESKDTRPTINGDRAASPTRTK